LRMQIILLHVARAGEMIGSDAMRGRERS